MNVTLRTPHLDAGNWIAIAAAVVSVFIATATNSWYFSNKFTTAELSIERNRADITRIDVTKANQDTVASIRLEFEAYKVSNEARAQIYVPRIEILEKAQSVLTERLQTTGDANVRRDKVLDDLRTAVEKLSTVVAILTERIPPKKLQ